MHMLLFDMKPVFHSSETLSLICPLRWCERVEAVIEGGNVDHAIGDRNGSKDITHRVGEQHCPGALISNLHSFSLRIIEQAVSDDHRPGHSPCGTKTPDRLPCQGIEGSNRASKALTIDGGKGCWNVENAIEIGSRCKASVNRASVSTWA